MVVAIEIVAITVITSKSNVESIHKVPQLPVYDACYVVPNSIVVNSSLLSTVARASVDTKVNYIAVVGVVIASRSSNG